MAESSLLYAAIDPFIDESQRMQELCDAVGVESDEGRDQVCLAVHRLLLWAARARVDGHLGNIKDWALSRAIQWRGDPARLLKALLSSKWLVQNEGGLYIEGWDRHAGRAWDKRRTDTDSKRTRRGQAEDVRLKDKERKRRQRALDKQKRDNTDCPPDIRTMSDAKEEVEVKEQIQNLEPTDDKQESPEVLSAEVDQTAVVGEAVSAHEPGQDTSTGPPGIQPDAQQRVLDAHEGVQRVDPIPAHGLVPISRLKVPQNANHEMAAGSSVHSTSTHTLHDPLNVPQPAHEEGDDVPLTAEQALSVACTADPHNFGLPTNVIPSHAKAFRPMAGIVTRWDIKLALWRCRLKTAGDCLPGVRSRLYTIGLLLHYLRPPMARRLHGARADHSQRMAREVGNLVKHQEDRRALAEEGAYNKQPTVYGWMRSSN